MKIKNIRGFISRNSADNHSKSKCKQKKEKNILSVYFGVPGSGKTTFATHLARKDLKRKRKVYSNVPITGTYAVNCKEDLGVYDISNGRLIIDEAGIEFNNRDFKKFSDDALYFFKYHRHYRVQIDVFSQGFDDMDKKIRTLAQELYVVKKSLIPFFVVAIPIGKRIGINELSKDIIDEYFFYPWFTFKRKYCFMPFTWKYFNSYSHKELKTKDFPLW